MCHHLYEASSDNFASSSEPSLMNDLFYYYLQHAFPTLSTGSVFALFSTRGPTLHAAGPVLICPSRLIPNAGPPVHL